MSGIKQASDIHLVPLDRRKTSMETFWEGMARQPRSAYKSVIKRVHRRALTTAAGTTSPRD